jgi:cysteinyl-tRNA synthetase
LEILKKTLNNFIFDVLGLENEKDKSSKSKLADTVKILINIRNQARKEKNFKLSDQIRNQLIDVGIQLNDSKDGTNFFVD